MKLKHSHAVWLMVLAPLLWSTAGVVTRQLENARAFEITFWRSFFTALSLMVILPLWQGRDVWARMWRERRALLLSGLCWGVMFTAFMVALTLTSVANVLITLAAGPLLTALTARVVIGHRLPARTWAAIVVAGLGIAYMFGSQLGEGGVLGTLVAFCVPVAASINWTLVQRSQRSGHQVDLVPAVLVGAVISSLATLPLAWPFVASAHDIALLAGLGLGQLAVPCALAVVCARVLSAPEVSLLALLEVLFGIVLAWLGAGEVPSQQVMLGGLLVTGALLANEWLGWRERAGHYHIETLDTDAGEP
ncbi:DMT family transporter [Hydrogenophaga sp. OTU3427]|uniref:DMT family transporter n=1 Tax=Hydrogenophaga sp. OTU3427 TaxID=3043856 RepID=UPI00313C8113